MGEASNNYSSIGNLGIGKRQKSQFSDNDDSLNMSHNLRESRRQSNFLKNISNALGATPSGLGNQVPHKESFFGMFGGTRKSTENYNVTGMRNSFSINDNSVNAQNEKNNQQKFNHKFSITGHFLNNANQNSGNRMRPSTSNTHNFEKSSHNVDQSKQSSIDKKGENSFHNLEGSRAQPFLMNLAAFPNIQGSSDLKMGRSRGNTNNG